MVTLGLSVNVSNDCESLSLDQFGNEICIHKDNSLICVNTCTTSNPSLPYTLNSVGIHYEEVDTISLCFDGQPWMLTDTLLRKIRKRLHMKEHQKVVIVPSQQLSYAYTSHYTSGLEKSLLIVSNKEHDAALPTLSYFWADRNEISLIGEEFPPAEEVSFSNVFRHLADYLNLNDPLEVQRLALFGKELGVTGQDIWYLDELKQLRSHYTVASGNLLNLPEMLETVGAVAAKPRLREQPLRDEHAELAFFVQSQIEKWFTAKIRSLLEAYPVRNLCITGELSENHLLLNWIRSELGMDVYVPPVDYSQNLSIGNTIYALLQEGDGTRNINELKLKCQMENIFRTYLCCC